MPKGGKQGGRNYWRRVYDRINEYIRHVEVEMEHMSHAEVMEIAEDAWEDLRHNIEMYGDISQKIYATVRAKFAGRKWQLDTKKKKEKKKQEEEEKAQERIPAKKKKKRKDADPPNVEPPATEAPPAEPERPAPTEPPADIKQMSKYTSLPNDKCCFDLGTVHLEGKQSDFRGTQTGYTATKIDCYSRICHGVTNAKSYFVPFEGKISPGTQTVGGILYPLAFGIRATSADYSHETVGFNNDHTLTTLYREIKTNQFFNSTTFVDPTYAALYKGPDVLGSAYRRYLVKDQYVTLGIKNLSYAASGDTVTETHVTVWLLKTRADIITEYNAQKISDTGANDYLSMHPYTMDINEKMTIQSELNPGAAATRFGSALYTAKDVTGPVNAESVLRFDMNAGTTIKDTGILDNYSVESKKSFCFTAGQMVYIKYAMPKPQVMDFSSMLRARQITNTADGNSIMPVQAPSGSYFFLFEVHGGLEGRSGDLGAAPTGMSLEKWQLGIWASQRRTFCEILEDSKEKSTVINAANASKTFATDTDFNQDYLFDQKE